MADGFGLKCCGQLILTYTLSSRTTYFFKSATRARFFKCIKIMVKVDWLSLFFDLNLILVLSLHGSYFYFKLPFKLLLVQHFYFLFTLHLTLNSLHLISKGQLKTILTHFLSPTTQVNYWNVIFSTETLVYFLHRLRNREIAITDTLLVSLSSLILILSSSVKNIKV